MQFVVVFLLLFGFFSSTYSAPREGLPLLNPGGIGGIFEGPDSETIIIGPDGSEITSEQKGGAVIQDDGLAKAPIVVAEPELPNAAPILTEERIISAFPIVSSSGAPILVSAAPAIASAAPILASPATPLLTGETYAEPAPVVITGYAEAPLAPIEVKPIEIVQQDPHIIETEIVDAPDVEPDQSSDLKGASGRIITKGSASIVSGPASTTITEPRKIIVAPPKLAIGTPVIATATIPLREVPLAAPLPAIAAPLPAVAPTAFPVIAAPLPPITASSIAPFPEVSYEARSTSAPPLLSYSTTAAPVEYGYSTTAAPLVGETLEVVSDSTRINLGVNDFRQSIPVIEYSSSNGVISGPAFLNTGTYSSTEAPLASSSIATITTDKFAPFEGPAVPPAYLVPPEDLVPPEAPQNPTIASQAPGLESSTALSYVQKIPRIEDNVAVDGRVDMADPSYEKFTSKSYQLPHVLGLALSRFYRKVPNKDKYTVTIDDKLGELTQNEITSYDTRRQFLPPPNLSQSKYIAPALARNGIDASQVNFAPIPPFQVTRLSGGAYQRGYNPGYFENRYQRNAKKRRSY